MAFRLCSASAKLSAVICSDAVCGIPELRKSYNGIGGTGMMRLSALSPESGREKMLIPREIPPKQLEERKLFSVTPGQKKWLEVVYE